MKLGYWPTERSPKLVLLHVCLEIFQLMSDRGVAPYSVNYRHSKALGALGLQKVTTAGQYTFHQIFKYWSHMCGTE